MLRANMAMENDVKTTLYFHRAKFLRTQGLPTPIREGNLRIFDEDYKSAEFVRLTEDTGCYNGQDCTGCGGLLKEKSVGIRRNGMFEAVPMGTKMEFKGKRGVVVGNEYSPNGEK